MQDPNQPANESTGSDQPPTRFTRERLSNACTNFRELLSTPELLVKSAANFTRATRLSVADVQAVLDSTQGDYVSVYYGVLDSVEGEHIIFMGPVQTAEGAQVSNGRLEAATELPVHTVAVPDCIGKIPPCPEITDQFVH